MMDEAEALVRELLAVPENYKVLFLQGGASSQFFMIPMNLLGPGKKATYLNTGTWAKKAVKEAKLFGAVDVAYSSEESSFNRVPEENEYTVDQASEYLYFCSNNTIYGTQFAEFPDKGKMLISDMSSDIFSRPLDVSRFGIIFAGAQKNIGPAGLTLVIVRDDLIGTALDYAPVMFRYKTHADNDSMYNTPPTYGWYLSGLVFQWLKEKGGLEAIARINHGKAKTLYDIIDASDFYSNPVDPDCRSWMNVPFVLADPELDSRFLGESKAAGLTN